MKAPWHKTVPGDEGGAARVEPSQNAFVHGATARIPSEATLDLYREFLGAPERPPASYATLRVDRSLWSLAEAELRVARTVSAERQHLYGNRSEVPDGPGPSADADSRGLVLSVDALKEIVTGENANIALDVARARQKAFWHKADLLARYRSEAESHRRQALKRYWLDVRSRDLQD